MARSDIGENIHTMVATLRSSGASPEWLIPGQRLRSNDPGHAGDLIVARIARDGMGLCHAVLRDTLGRETSTYVDQIQWSIATGVLTPLDVQSRFQPN